MVLSEIILHFRDRLLSMYTHKLDAADRGSRNLFQ